MQGFEILILTGLLGLAAGIVAIVHLWRVPNHVWRQLGVSPLVRVVVTALLLPVYGPFTLIAALVYWFSIGQKAQHLRNQVS